MGYKSKHDSYGKNPKALLADFKESVRLLKNHGNCRNIENRINGEDENNEFCYTVSGKHRALVLDVSYDGGGVSSDYDTEFVLLDPRFLEGKKSESSAEFYSISITGKDQYNFKKVTLDDIIMMYDPKAKGLPKKCNEYQLRKDIVLYQLGFESMGKKIADEIKTDPPIDKPRRGFFGTIRDFFNKDNAGRKAYEREKDRYIATKLRIVELELHLKLKYDTYSVDDSKAYSSKFLSKYEGPRKEVKEAEINKNLIGETKETSKKSVTNAAALKEKSITETLQYFKNHGSSSVMRGAEEIEQRLKNHQLSEDSQKMLTSFLEKGKCIRDKDYDSPAAKEYIDTFNNICEFVDENPDSLEISGQNESKKALQSLISSKGEKDIVNDI